MTHSLDTTALEQLFLSARTVNVWTDKPVSDTQVRTLYDLMKMGPTSANCSPARFVFIQSRTGKEKLATMMMPGNDEKVLAAPVTVIIGTDIGFAAKLPELFPHNPDAVNWFDDPKVRDETAVRNATLQGGYLIMAARAMGLDCGPMSGFDADQVKKTYFDGTTIHPNFICSIGYGSEEGIFPRSPRLSFDDACTVI